jgi:hypothetical protein
MKEVAVTIFKSAIDGKFVSRKFFDANPTTTFCQVVKKKVHTNNKEDK